MQVIIMFIYTFILNKVCTFKYGVKISWFLVALPIVFMIIGLIILVKILDDLDLNKSDLKDLMNQAKIMNKQQEEEDGLEGFEGCGNTN